MDKSKIKEALLKEGYPAFMLENTIDKIVRLNPNISQAFVEWLDNGTEPQIEVEGFSYASLKQMYGMKPIGIFITLDWLVREPEKAKKSLARGIK